MVVLVGIFSDVRAWTISDEAVERLRALAPHADIVHVRTQAELNDRIAAADVGFTYRIDRDTLARATRLRWIHAPSAGIGSLLFDELRRSPIVLTNSRGANAPAVAEHAIALLLAMARRLDVAVRRQGERVWSQNSFADPALRLLRGATLGIVGLGAIGCEVARLASALGMHVRAVRRHPDRPRPEGVADVMGIERLDDLLRESDALVLAAPLTPETRGLLGATELSLMKPDACFVNVARGQLVDEQALACWLADDPRRRAALDVFEHEPLDPASPLWSLPNILITPHVASVRDDYWTVAVDLFVENLRRFERGQPLLNLVDKDAGY